MIVACCVVNTAARHDVGALVAAGLVEVREQRRVRRLRLRDRASVADERAKSASRAIAAPVGAVHAVGDHERVRRALVEAEAGVRAHGEPVVADRLRPLGAERRDDRRLRAAIRRVGSTLTR